MPLWYQEIRIDLLLLQSLLEVTIFVQPLQKKKGFLGRVVLSTTIGLALCRIVSLYLYTRETTLSGALLRILCIVVVYFCLIGIVYFSLKESIWTALLTASSGYIVQDICGSIKGMLKVNLYFGMLAEHEVGVLLLDLICYGGGFVLMYFIMRRYIRVREDFSDDRLKAAFSFFVMLFCIGMARITQDNPSRNDMAKLSENIYQILCDVLLLIVQSGVLENAKLNRNVMVMKDLIGQQHIQYENSKESVQLVNEKYHDLKRLLQSFQGEISQKQLRKLEESIDSYDMKVDTGNTVTDVLLTEKRALCAQQNIQLTCQVGGVDTSFVEELDLYSLLVNALNNAIDAVSALEEGKDL